MIFLFQSYPEAVPTMTCYYYRYVTVVIFLMWKYFDAPGLSSPAPVEPLSGQTDLVLW